MSARFNFTGAPVERLRYTSSSGGTIVDIGYRFRNVGDYGADEGSFTNSWWAKNIDTSETRSNVYYPATDMPRGNECEDYIQLEDLGSGTWRVHIALNTRGQAVIAGTRGADDGRNIDITI